MTGKVYNVLFLCTGNSSRSIMSEALLTVLGRGRFKAYSAGSRPTGVVNSFAIQQIKQFDSSFLVDAMHSKGWLDFAQPSAPHMDFIITVCDSAAGEACPHWPGHPTTAHWGYPDPAQVSGSQSEKQEAFRQVFEQIRKRVEQLIALPLNWLEDDSVRRVAVRAIATRKL
ncbi:arsenate reductase ArsC [Telluria aromaticivorans]|uniref:Arsenate reductase ArsC n=1 Tax=Telluria aromaticivorans TaxID=2725995 RepID=A0A7Y2JV50_9BURK|nr:arsenate reductase ArsC [Telluria aromaticivorans]NNG21577.1 arsenate reductase ArsC [Telluria aromaticivorans]